MVNPDFESLVQPGKGLESMKTRAAYGQPTLIGSFQVTALVCFGAMVVPAYADPSTTTRTMPTEVTRSITPEAVPGDKPSRIDSKLGSSVSSAKFGIAGNDIAPRGNDMSVLAGIELERNDRQFRSRVVDWARDRSVVAGVATDFLVHGSDTGFYLRLQSRAEYLVRWETRF